MQPWHKWGAALVLGATLGASHAQILVGQTAGFSGQVAAGVQETTQGAKLFLDAVNGKGGVHGQKIELISMDDKFERPMAAASPTDSCDKPLDVRSNTTAWPKAFAIAGSVDLEPTGRPRRMIFLLAVAIPQGLLYVCIKTTLN